MVSPYEVTSPKDKWQLIDVLYIHEEDPSWSLAIGEWSGKYPGRKLVCRWNGDEDQPNGHPVIRMPTWFILPDEFVAPLMQLIPPAKRALVDAMLKEAA